MPPILESMAVAVAVALGTCELVDPSFQGSLHPVGDEGFQR